MNKETPSKKIDAQAEKLLLLLSLLRQMRAKDNAAEIAFMMVNETYRLVPYRQAVYWTETGGVETVSGLAEVEINSPYLLWLSDFIRRHLPSQRTGEEEKQMALAMFSAKDISPEDQKNWAEYCSLHAALLALYDRSGHVTGALWINREEVFSTLDKVLLDEMADGYGHALSAVARGKKKRYLRGWKAKIPALVFLVACFWPVRLSVTAPAEIVAKDPYVVSVPFDGILAEITIEPNSAVKAGDVLARIDDTALRGQATEAEHRLGLAEAVLEKTERESITDAQKKQALAELRAEIALRKQELDYARSLLQKTKIAAPRAGVAIFSDRNDWRGRPVQTGERIMMLTPPQDTELLIRVPVDAMIDLNAEASASYFLTTAPMARRLADIRTIGYQPSLDPDGLLTYKIRASFRSQDVPRVGLTGTAKLYGGRSVFGYAVLRRPLMALRRLLGV